MSESHFAVLGDHPEYAASLMSDAASSATEWDVLHLVWQVDLAEQRRAAVDRPSVRHVAPSRDLADAATKTYSSRAHEKGVPAKVIAQLMGHAKIDTTLNVYTRVIDGSLRRAADTVVAGLEPSVSSRSARWPLGVVASLCPTRRAGCVTLRADR